MKKTILPGIFLAIVLSGATTAWSQKEPARLWPVSPSGKVRCFTDEMERWRTGGNSGMKPIDRWINGQIGLQPSSTGAGRIVPIVYTIPVIFHIVHSGEAFGTGTNIDSAYVYAQITQLNNDMRRMAGTSGYNTHAAGADVRIQFVAATLDTSNNQLAEPGIHRVNKSGFGVTNPPFNAVYIDNTIKPASIWDPTRYFNIWVLDLNGLLGYAQFPDAPNEPGVGVNNAANTDGVVVHYSTVGSSTRKFPGGYPYDEGRTLTHETGHWLGLRHIWGDGNCATDDFAFDTPRASGPNFGCPAPIPNSCNDLTYGGGADSSDMISNYMDYTDDGCMNIFTQGQMARMRVVMGETGAGAPRRAVLRLSDRASTGPLVSMLVTDTTVLERTSCAANGSFVIPVRISRAPNANTTVTLSLSSGALNGQDYSISPASVEFTSTDSSDKNFTLLIAADGVMEGHEIGYFNLAVSGSNAVAATDSLEVLVRNDDWGPDNGKRIPATLYTEDFEGAASGWIVHNYVVGNNSWVVGGTNGNLNGNKSAYISSDNSSLTYDANSTSHSLLYREVDATYFDSLVLSLYYVCKGEKDINGVWDFGKLVYSTDSITFYQINGTTDLVDSSNTTFLSTPLPYFLSNRKFYLGFYWENDFIAGNDPPFAIDDITITGHRWMPSMIETAVDTSAGYDEKNIGPFETVHFYDRTSGDILATVQDLGGYNWGCVRVEIDRSGIGAQWLTGDPQTTPATKLFDKTYRIVPTNNNSSGQYNVTFYLTQNEVNGWQGATGLLFPSAQVLKYSGRIQDMTYSSSFTQNPGLPAAYQGGSDYQITAQFTNGFSGFGFGFIPPVTLPVNLLSFTGKPQKPVVELRWTTTGEENLDRFELWRSANGVDFEKIADIPARGASGSVTEYPYTDRHPNSGKNYYRLRLSDRDGRFRYSQVVQVDFSQSLAVVVTPNPFRDRISLEMAGETVKWLQLTLTDVYGRILSKWSYLQPGNRIIIPTGMLAAGLYFLRINHENGTQVTRLIKEK